MWGRVWSLTCVQLGPSLFWQGRCATVSNAVDPPLSRGRRRMGELLELVLEPISKLSEQDHKASELDEAE